MTNPKFDKQAALDVFKATITNAAVSTSNVTFYKFEVGKPLCGEIKTLGQFTHDKYGPQKTAIIEADSGEVVSVILPQYVLEKMRREDAESGDLIFIDFQGKGTSKSGNQYNKYHCEIQKANAAQVLNF